MSLAVPPGSLEFWKARLGRGGVRPSTLENRFGQRVLPLVDPHGLRLALVESASSLGRAFTPWERSPIPLEHQIRGLEGARLVERALEETVSFLEDALGFRKIGEEECWQRYGLGEGGSGAVCRPASGARRTPWRLGDGQCASFGLAHGG